MDEQRNSRMRRSTLYGPLALVLLSVAAVIFLSIFFRVSIIQVENDTVYTDEEILAKNAVKTEYTISKNGKNLKMTHSADGVDTYWILESAK